MERLLCARHRVWHFVFLYSPAGLLAAARPAARPAVWSAEGYRSVDPT